MAALSKKLRSVEGGRIGFWCPGCKEMHVIRVSAPTGNWEFDGNVEAPTFAPSVLVEERCHSFVRAGQIEFLADCTHALAGKTVPLPDCPNA